MKERINNLSTMLIHVNEYTLNMTVQKNKYLLRFERQFTFNEVIITVRLRFAFLPDVSY